MSRHVKTRKLLQICKQVETRLLSSRYQDVCFFPVVVRSLEQVLLSPSYKVDDANRFDTSCSNKNNLEFLWQDVINLLTTCYTYTSYQTCWNNDLNCMGVCWSHQPCYKMITTCSRLVTNWEQAVRKHLDDKLWEFHARNAQSHSCHLGEQYFTDCDSCINKASILSPVTWGVF
jgi:hypothetical protein